MSEQLNFSFPSPSQFKHFGSILSKKEKILLYLAIFILVGALVAWAINYYISSTEKRPHVGGEYTEGVVGQPLHVNPILSGVNETDETLCKLVFSSLLSHDKEGFLVNDLAEKYELSEDKKTYTFYIKQNVQWHDKVPLTAHDIAFTVKLIQTKAFKSSLRGDWQDVNVNVIDDHAISFSIPEPYSPFPNKATFGILPKHVFEDVSAENFLLSEFNLKPVGSGPFVFSHFEQNEEDDIISYQLLANKSFYDGPPFLEKVNFNFYSEEQDLIEAYNKKEINGFGLISYENVKDFEEKKGTQIFSMKTPRYFAIFFNKTKSIPLANKDVRKALMLATNRDEIVDQVFYDHAKTEFSPILVSFGEFESSKSPDNFSANIEEAERILEEAGWKKGEDGIRQKDGQKLEFSLITTQWQDLAKTAPIIKAQWERVGAIVNISNLEFNDIQDNFIKPREYQAILYGQKYLGNDPDPFFFWHSSRRKDPGRNIALYNNEEVDALLDEARKTSDLNKRKEDYKAFEEKIYEDVPAVFLYSPDYVYIMNSKIKGIDTGAIVDNAHRFTNIKNWYIKTTRTKKDQ